MRPFRIVLRVCSWPLRALWTALDLFGSRAAAERELRTQPAHPHNPTELNEQRTYGIRETIR